MPVCAHSMVCGAPGLGAEPERTRGLGDVSAAWRTIAASCRRCSAQTVSGQNGSPPSTPRAQNVRLRARRPAVALRRSTPPSTVCARRRCLAMSRIHRARQLPRPLASSCARWGPSDQTDSRSRLASEGTRCRAARSAQPRPADSSISCGTDSVVGVGFGRPSHVQPCAGPSRHIPLIVLCLRSRHVSGGLCS